MGVDTEKEMDMVTRKVERVFKVWDDNIQFLVFPTKCKLNLVKSIFPCNLKSVTVSVSSMMELDAAADTTPISGY